MDLGLPSGLKWATYNVGATSAAQLGRLFKWGEIYDIYDKRPKNNLSKKPIRDIQGNPAYICRTRGFKLTSKINGKYIF